MPRSKQKTTRAHYAREYRAEHEADFESPAQTAYKQEPKLDWSAVDDYMARHQGDDLTLVREKRGYVMRLVRKLGGRVEVVAERVIGHEPKPLAGELAYEAAMELTR